MWTQLSWWNRAIRHIFTQPYRPQTNGKTERFKLTLKNEWAYVRPYISNTQRLEDLDAWLHNYNHDRPHTALKGRLRCHSSTTWWGTTTSRWSPPGTTVSS